jgi:hypothetical protein
MSDAATSSGLDVDSDPIVADVFAELRAEDIRRIQAGHIAPGLMHILAAIDDQSVTRVNGRWMACINYSADMLRDAGMAWVETNPDGVEYLALTAEGDDALLQQPDSLNVPTARVWPAWLLWLVGVICLLGAASGAVVWAAR